MRLIQLVINKIKHKINNIVYKSSILSPKNKGGFIDLIQALQTLNSCILPRLRWIV